MILYGIPFVINNSACEKLVQGDYFSFMKIVWE